MKFNPSLVAHHWAQKNALRSFHETRTSSTNQLAKDDANGAFYHLITADHQTQGRGRFDRHWQDRGAGQLLSSWVFETSEALEPMFAARAGLALYHAASQTWSDGDWSLKAPNDLYLGALKVAGLLIEVVSPTKTQGPSKVIVGLGLNVFAAPDLPWAGFLNLSLKESLLTETSFHRFLSRWNLELKLALENQNAALDSAEAHDLQKALGKNLLEPRVIQLKDSGILLFNNGSEKKWMDL